MVSGKGLDPSEHYTRKPVIKRRVETHPCTEVPEWHRTR